MESPPGLRIIHAIVFLGFASVTIAGAHQELLHLARGLMRPFSAGTPPHAIACASGLAAALGALILIVCVARRRTVPLVVSGLILLAFAGSLTLLQHEPKQRTVPGANVKALQQAQALHEKLNGPLQRAGQVLPDAASTPIEAESPFYERPFKPLPWHIEASKRTDALPDGAKPGWLLLHVEDSQAAFVITAVGIDEDGEPSLLRAEGKPIEYRGAYNPDIPE